MTLSVPDNGNVCASSGLRDTCTAAGAPPLAAVCYCASVSLEAKVLIGHSFQVHRMFLTAL